MKDGYIVTFYTDGDFSEPQICYFQTEEGAKALYDTLVESELIWKVALSKIQEYHF